MMGPVEDAMLEEARRRQQPPNCTDGTDIAAMLGEARYEDGSPMTEPATAALHARAIPQAPGGHVHVDPRSAGAYDAVSPRATRSA